MSISKRLTITVSEDTAKLSGKMYVYEGDYGVDFYLKILSSNVTIVSNVVATSEVSLLAELENSYASISVKCPNGTIFKRTNIPIINDEVIFTITKDITDELADIGVYKLQIHLHDGNLETSNRITIPPIQFEVKSQL